MAEAAQDPAEAAPLEASRVGLWRHTRRARMTKTIYTRFDDFLGAVLTTAATEYGLRREEVRAYMDFRLERHDWSEYAEKCHKEECSEIDVRTVAATIAKAFAPPPA